MVGGSLTALNYCPSVIVASRSLELYNRTLRKTVHFCFFVLKQKMTFAKSKSTYLNELEMLQSEELLVTRYNKSDGIFKASCKMFMFFM